MKKNNKSYAVGWVVLVLAVAAAVLLGQLRKPASGIPPERSDGLDTSLDTAAYEGLIRDGADVLSADTEDLLALYNANWDASYSSRVAFVSVDSIPGSAEDYADQLSEESSLTNSDALLLVVEETGEFQFVWGYDFGGMMTTRTQDRLNAAALSGNDWDHGVAAFYEQMDTVYRDYFGSENGLTGEYAGTLSLSWLFYLIWLVLLAYFLLSAIDRARYNAYRAQYYGVASPPVVFRPIFFWHGPRYGWYTRHWHAPPPPPPRGPRGPTGGFGGGSFGGSRSGSFSRGGSFGGSRGGGFGGRR